jgi:pimeloyl-ACP methyl ester carboxylesterase
MPFATVNDIDIHYRLAGQGEQTIVCINGLADDLETWAFQEEALTTAGYRLLLFDNRGLGKTSKPAVPPAARRDPQRGVADGRRWPRLPLGAPRAVQQRRHRLRRPPRKG